MPPTAVSAVELSVDKVLLGKVQSKNPRIAILGFHLSGMSTTAERIKTSSPEFRACDPVDVQLDSPLPLIADHVGRCLQKPQSIILLHDYWNEIVGAKETNWLPEQYRSLITSLRLLFSKFEKVEHNIEKADALNILRKDWESLGFSDGDLSSPIEKQMLQFSRFGSTHIPRLIHEATNEWARTHDSIGQVLKKQERTPDERRLVGNELNSFAQSLGERAKDRKSMMTMLGIGVSATLGANVLNVLQIIANAGMKSTILGSALAFPIAELFMVGAAVGFGTAKKKDMPDGLRGKFESYSQGFLAAQAYWNSTTLTPTEKDLIGYTLDKSVPLPLGTAKKELDAHFATNRSDLKALGDELLDRLQPAIFAELEKSLVPLQDELDAVWMGLDEALGRIERLELEIKGVKDLVKYGQGRVSESLRTSWTFIPNPGQMGEADLMAMLNLQFYASEEDGSVKIPEFVPFVSERDEETLEKTLASNANLLITGRKGSGKSRVIFEALQRRRTKAGDLWVVGRGPKSVEGTVGKLIEEMRSKAATGTSLLLWDNFPADLEDNQSLEVCNGVLRSLAGLPRDFSMLLSLDSDYYSARDEIIGQDVNLDVYDVQYNQKGISRLLHSIGKSQLGAQYSQRIGNKGDRIAEVLYDKMPRPLYVTLFCQKLKGNPNKDGLEVAKELASEDLARSIRKELKKLESDDLELRKKEIGHSNVDLLYSIKLSKMTGQGASMAKVESMQKTILGSSPFEPFRYLHGWVEAASGTYLFHDLYSDALEFSDDSLRLIFESFEKHGLKELFGLKYAVEEITGDEGPYLGDFGKFLGRHCSFVAPAKMAPILQRYDASLAGGVGESFDLMPPDYCDALADCLFAERVDEKGKAVQFITGGGDAFAEGAGRRFREMDTQSRNKLLELANRKGHIFAYAVGHGIAERLYETSDDYEEHARIIESLSKLNKDLAEGLRAVYRHCIMLDCPPGWPRPGDLIDGVTKDTGLPSRETASRFFGNWTWDYGDIPSETWNRARPILRERISKLYEEKWIRYGRW